MVACGSQLKAVQLDLLRKCGLLVHTSAAFSEKCFVVTVPPEQLQTICFLLPFTRWGGLVRPASKSGRFSHHPLRVPKGWHGDFAACGQRSGLLALNLANIFEKLLDQKTFICLWLILGIPLAYDSARLGHIPSLPWQSQLPLKPCVLLQPLDFIGNCDSLRFSPRF